MTEERLSKQTRELLRAAGWYPGRRAPKLVRRWETELFERSGYTLHDAARAVLMEMGGLAIHQRGPGLSKCRSDFAFDPTSSVDEEFRFEAMGRALGKTLCPVGDADAESSFLAVAEDGTVVVLMDRGMVIGASMEEGLESLVLGRMHEVFDGVFDE